MNIYIHTQGARIVREGRHLLVKKGEDTYHTLFVEKLRQVVLFGTIALTPAARNLLLRHGVDTVFCTRGGRYLGRFANPEPKNVALRRRQFTVLDDEPFGTELCRQIVTGKLLNMATLLMRVNRTRRRDEPRRAAREIRSLIDTLAKADSIESIRGYEGRAGAIYFGAFRWGLQQDFGFCRRVRRPPTDPVNAVLSLLYTFLFNRVYAAIRQVNLDPYPAFLHTPDYGRHSLVMDLMEEFRVIIVDTLTLSLFNLKILQKDDFQLEYPPAPVKQTEAGAEAAADITSDPYGHMADLDCREQFDLPGQRMSDEIARDGIEEFGAGKPAVKLTAEAFRRVVENFERKLTTEFHYPPEERTITYSDSLVAQAALYRKVIEGELRVYQPLLLK
ncbi:MAG: CRISPR-associated endonuclease Cas1 [Desulfofustis sp. PB-SRB1]|jgi:CRISPR-associated protein Cas1|nr:CRISPR-associated endonuclease Cas1 [Desulfofustis sp. PB-SRB1]MBM1003142.1 CRISPR-associated endonuclease Cas1 [Desulfofustis sp. PB-SRB1]HBH28513.1 CRISPR-associated endonuclease Cas1 [Desulfofustis sp.]